MIKPKPKPCKGTSSVSVKGCGAIVLNRKYGLCFDCYRNWLLNTEDGKEKMNKSILKASKERRELEQVERREKDRKRITYLLNNIRNLVHKYIRLRDQGKPCISCGIPYKDNFQAGHFFKSELYSTLRFEENNIHGQCPKCNMYLEGNLNKYDENLPKRIGVDAYNNLKLKAEKDKQVDYKWNREELEEIRKYYKQKIKEL